MSVQHRHGQKQTARILTTPRSFLAAILSVACMFSVGIDVTSLSATPPAAKDKRPKQDPALKGLPITELSADEAIFHALNRLAYGPRPSDIERVRQMGLAKWIDQQLNPNSIDDKAVEARLDPYATLRMSSKQLLGDYPQPKQAEKQAQKGTAATQTRGDAAAAVVAQDMRADQTGASESSTVADAPNSVSPMKQSASQTEANPPTPGAGGGGKRGA